VVSEEKLSRLKAFNALHALVKKKLFLGRPLLVTETDQQ
jgi:hypothetical protein